MKKVLLTVFALAALTLLALPQSSYAQVEALGMYFAANDSSCTTGAFLDHITAYIVYLNPQLPETRGFECGYDLTLPAAKGAAINTNISVSFPVSATDVGVDDSPNGNYNRIVGYSGPVATSGATIMATLDIFVLDAGQIDITMRPASPQSPPLDGNPKVVKGNFDLLSVPQSNASGSASLVINGATPCGVTLDSEDMSFGAVKSLFR